MEEVDFDPPEGVLGFGLVVECSRVCFGLRDLLESAVLPGMIGGRAVRCFCRSCIVIADCWKAFPIFTMVSFIRCI